jgi:hypothetical protein
MPQKRPDIEATEPEISSSGSSKSNVGTTRHTEDAHRHSSQASVPRQKSVTAKLHNPLAGLSEEQVLADVETWYTEKGLSDELDSFRKGALIARVGQRDDDFEYVRELSEEEKGWLRHETTHRWSQPKMLYFLVVLCAGSAIVQGMDQTAVNGAQVWSLSLPLYPNHHANTYLPALLLPRVRHHRRLAAGPSQRRTIPMLRAHRLLVQRSTEQILRPSRHNLHILHHGHLDGFCEQLAQPAHRPLLPGFRRRRKVIHHAHLRRRISAEKHPRRADYDVANVDCIRHHARFRRLRRFPKRYDPR